MTANEIVKLIDAGFTKDEIFKLDADVKVVPDSNKADDKKIPDPKPEPEQKPDPVSAAAPQVSGVTLSDDQFTKLLQQLNVQGASLDVPPESDMSKKLGDHFKDVLIGG